jgi:hypothetical protein
VLRVSAHGKAMLLAADIEAAQEMQLIETAAGQLRADVLLAPHHVMLSLFWCLKTSSLYQFYRSGLPNLPIILYSSAVSVVSFGLIERLLFSCGANTAPCWPDRRAVFT